MLIPVQMANLPVKGQNPDTQDERQKPAIAWQREMERAQMELWLRQRTVSHGGASGALQELQVAPAPLMHGGRIEASGQAPRSDARDSDASGQRTVPEMEDPQRAAAPADLAASELFAGIAALEWTPSADTVTAPAKNATTHPSMATGGAMPIADRLARVWNEVLPGAVAAPEAARAAPKLAAKAAAMPAEAALPAQDKSAPLVQQPPVRVQYHLTEAGLAVWLGVDRGVSLDIQALVLQLRQALERQGLKLHSLTHNGRHVLHPEHDPAAQSPAGEPFSSSLSSPSPGAAP